MTDGLSVEELAARANVTSQRVEQLAGLGLIAPRGDRYHVDDIGRVSVVEALVDEGVPIEDLARAAASGVVSLAWFGGVLPPAPADRPHLPAV